MTKKEALSIVFVCAPLYKENLVDKSLLFITTDKHKSVHCLEVTFDISNFLHMTGFKLRKPGINARHFFNLCYDKRLPETSCQGLFHQIHKKSTKKVPEAPYGS